MATKAKEIFNDLNLVLRLNQHIEELTATEESAAALLAKESSFQVLTELSSIETPDPREDAQFDHQRALFRGATDASSLPFHLQGDQAFNEASALARRRQLRHSEAVKSKIQFLWHVARGRNAVVELTQQQQQGGGSRDSNAMERARERKSSEPKQTPLPSTATINQREYADMMLLIFKVLRDDFVLATAQRQIQCDWEVDSHHGNALSYDQFFPALFELVDVWTCDMLEATYARFLELLTRRITVRVVVFLDDMKLKLALSDNFDEAVVVKSIPLSTIKQFASVAKVMEGTGVRTVGDLASTDPRVVEKQRVGYLDRNAFSKEKIGADLEHLLKMFREISDQFQDANHTLRSQALQRSHHDRGMGVGAPSDGFSSTEGVDDARIRHQGHDSAGSRTNGDRQATFSSDHGESTNADGISSSSRNGAGDSFSATHHLGADRESTGAALRHDTSDALIIGERNGRGSGRGGGGDGRGGTNGGGGNQADARRVVDPSSNAETEAILRRGGVKRINTFRDITVTETGVLDALKASFLIEKGISLQRKTSLGSIKAELLKFGVDTTTMDDAAIQEKYDRLYETFVLRDGDNIKALAESILARIKLELAAHGIEVGDDDIEALYDGFYGSVVAGSGDRIVADAKSWVGNTVNSNSYGSYIKQDYHELKSIDEVKLVGSGAEDEEFVSLLSKEDGSDDEDGGKEHADFIGKAAESPTMKAVAPLSRRPSLYRGLSDSPKKDNDQSGRPIGGTSMKDLPSIDSYNGAESAVGDEHPDFPASSEELGFAISVDNLHNLPDEDDSAQYQQNDLTSKVPGQDHSQVVDVPEDIGIVSTAAHDEGAQVRAVELILDPVVEQKAQEDSPEDTEIDALAGSSDASTKVMGDDELYKRSSVVPLMTTKSNSNLLDGDAASNLDGNHGHLNESDREAQGVGYEYEEHEEPPIVEARAATPERSIIREPKIPDIIVGGIDAGKNIAVTARYIQLLGLGNVLTVTPESVLMAQLKSPRKESIDLVLYDIGDELDTAVARAKDLVALMGRRVIFLGGDERQPEKSAVTARLCVSEGGLVYFGTIPIDFPALRAEIQTFFEASPHLYIMRQRRATGVFGAAAKLLTSSIRASNIICVEEDHPRSVLTPPLSVDTSSAKRKASEVSTPVVTSLPQVVAPKRDAFSPFRSLRAIDEMPGADVAFPRRFTPVMPPSHASKAKGKSPRMSAALKKLMR